ncbi:hypothetical protein BZG36_01528 [Bifiguratus adelaidae]|uniref:Eukaryotic translation initiation factor 3 subunit L n=1 Tax=Bifiguratus adelaidae TaxID=1938954 RepID=A0A261Y4V3_9FUNG|nr:hypothetical protein BZG36_01528 [Bifiguratus adelaidae]
MYQDTLEEEDIAAEVDMVTDVAYQEHGMEDFADDDYAAHTQQQIPNVVKNFILYFHRHVVENNVHELHGIYENAFNKITEKYFSKEAWPDAESISHLVNDDQVFLTLYRELYYRHIYSRLTPIIEHRFHSYENYCDLFNYILNSEGPVHLELPNQWLWDIIDEFIYQFQSFCNYRNRIKSKSEEEIRLLRENPQIWSCYSVLNVLYSLIQKSRIKEQLLTAKTGGDMAEVAGEYNRPLYKMLGYFSIVGLLRVHCLLGDFTLALKMMDNIELNKKALFARVTACHVTTYYYVGFAYMMMRRYADAIKAFSHILVFIQRTKQYHTRSYQYDQIAKKADQMYALLAICIALCPTRLDENIHTLLREKYGEQLARIQKGTPESHSTFEDLFLYACPKFISANGPNYDDSVQPIEPQHHHATIFLNDVKQTTHVPTLRSFLKLYTSMGVDKLAAFLDMQPEELASQLIIFKQASRQERWRDATLLEGEYSPTSDLDFYLKQDMIHIAESKAGMSDTPPSALEYTPTVEDILGDGMLERIHRWIKDYLERGVTEWELARLAYTLDYATMGFLRQFQLNTANGMYVDPAEGLHMMPFYVRRHRRTAQSVRPPSPPFIPPREDVVTLPPLSNVQNGTPPPEPWKGSLPRMPAVLASMRRPPEQRGPTVRETTEVPYASTWESKRRRLSDHPSSYSSASPAPSERGKGKLQFDGNRKKQPHRHGDFETRRDDILTRLLNISDADLKLKAQKMDPDFNITITRPDPNLPPKERFEQAKNLLVMLAMKKPHQGNGMNQNGIYYNHEYYRLYLAFEQFQIEYSEYFSTQHATSPASFTRYNYNRNAAGPSSEHRHNFNFISMNTTATEKEKEKNQLMKAYRTLIEPELGPDNQWAAFRRNVVVGERMHQMCKVLGMGVLLLTKELSGSKMHLTFTNQEWEVFIEGLERAAWRTPASHPFPMSPTELLASLKNKFASPLWFTPQGLPLTESSSPTCHPLDYSPPSPPSVKSEDEKKLDY